MTKLDIECISYIGRRLKRGIMATKDYFNLTEMPKIALITESKAQVPHYIHGEGIIGLPLGFIMKYSSRDLETLRNHEVETSIEGMADEFVNFGYWIASAGVEETIHYLQDTGHESVNQSIPNFQGYSSLSKLDMLLAAHEVEARELVDKILPTTGIPPMWKNINKFLKSKYPEKYGKPAQPQT